ncbi:MAG TPA: hypothetical protein VGK59_21615 [Ohtaekwangia sp.]
MTLNEFKATLQQTTPPSTLTPLLKAMWHEGKGDWEAAHNIAQEINTSEGSWIHAYLHRVEGDLGNASYWYHRAGKPVFTGDLKHEWNSIVEALLQNNSKN